LRVLLVTLITRPNCRPLFFLDSITLKDTVINSDPRSTICSSASHFIVLTRHMNLPYAMTFPIHRLCRASRLRLRSCQILLLN